MDSIFVSQTKGRGFDSPWGYYIEGLTMAKKYKIRTIRNVKGEEIVDHFQCIENDLDTIYIREKANKNTMKIFVDGRQVYP